MRREKKKHIFMQFQFGVALEPENKKKHSNDRVLNCE